jgi:phosphoribosylformimino-5-aminoimidazole carboxamide ribonucleotide (ProFAR) isomerase
LAEAKGIKLIASGGISTFDELPKLAELRWRNYNWESLIMKFRWNN